MKKVAVVTGASAGMGKEFTLQISQKYDFDEIWIIARRKELLEEIAENNSSIKPVQIDLTGENGVKDFEAFLKTQRDFTISLFVNNAGFGTYGPFEQTPLERETKMVELNCTALTGLCSLVIPYMEKGSVIINTSSMAAFMPLGNFAVYAATKSYVLSFSIALAAELKDKGIKVCALCPGSVSTEFANVASNGARKVVKGGIESSKVVSHCLKRAFKGKKTAIYKLQWKFTAFFSRFFGRYVVARYTYKYCKRPYQN